MSFIRALLTHDIRLACRQGSSLFQLLGFFVIAAILFAFGSTAEETLLRSIGPGVIWVCALLASLLAVPKIFDEDYEDGSLSFLWLQGVLPEKIILAKILSHWIINLLPLVLIAPLLAVFFHSEASIIPLLLSLLLGTPTLCCLATLGAALTLGLKRGGGLIGVILLPLYIPVLIFGSSASSGQPSALWILTGLFGLMLPVSVVASSLAVKVGLGE